MLAEKARAVPRHNDPLVALVRKLSSAVIGLVAVAAYATGSAASPGCITV